MSVPQTPKVQQCPPCSVDEKFILYAARECGSDTAKSRSVRPRESRTPPWIHTLVRRINLNLSSASLLVGRSGISLCLVRIHYMHITLKSVENGIMDNRGLTPKHMTGPGISWQGPISSTVLSIPYQDRPHIVTDTHIMTGQLRLRT